MLDISLAEMAVVAVIAIVVLGPKELPVVLRTVGRWIGRAKSVGRHFREQLDLLDDTGDIRRLQRELEEEARFIKDEHGNFHRVYSLSDLTGDEDEDAEQLVAASEKQPPKSEVDPVVPVHLDKPKEPVA